jgi:transposase-like protein
VVKALGMKSSKRSRRRRARLLAAFDRSGLSAAAFARQHGLNYTTFCGWRQRRAEAKASPGFVQVEVAAPAAPAQLLIDLGAQARLPITSTAQIELAARLLQALNANPSC